MRRLLLCCFLSLSAPAVQPQGTGRPPPDFPPDWSPAGLEGCRERDTGLAVELYRDVGGVEVTAARELKCRVGFREELPILLGKRSSLEKRVTIVGAGPRGVSLDVTSVQMRRRRLGRVTPAVQTLLTHDAHILLKATIAKEEGVIPVRLVPQPTRPTFALGGLPAGLDEAGREAALMAALELPAQCLRLPAGDREAWLVHLRRRAAIAPQACLAVDVGREGWEAELAALAGEYADLVAFWQLEGWAPLPAGGEELQPAAVDEFVGLIRHAASTVHVAAPLATVLAPPLPAWSAGTPPQAELVRALGQQQDLGLGAIVVEYAPSAVPAGEDAPEVWAEMDRAADLAAVREGIGAEAQSEIGIWWVRHGAAAADARLGALRLVRDVVLAASGGAMGLEYRPSPQQRHLWTPESAAQDEAMAALGEIMAELSGASPCWEWRVGDEYCSSQPGSPLTFRYFIRGGEGIVFLWSNAPKRVEFQLALRQEPLGLREVTLSTRGTMLSRKTDLEFVAETRDKQGNYLVEGALAPLEVRAYSFPLQGAHRAWLAAVRRR